MAQKANVVDEALDARGAAKEQITQLVYGVVNQSRHLFKRSRALQVMTRLVGEQSGVAPDQALVAFYSGLSFPSDDVASLSRVLIGFRDGVGVNADGQYRFDDNVGPIYGFPPGETLPPPLSFLSRHAGVTLVDGWMLWRPESEAERTMKLETLSTLEAKLLLSWRALELASSSLGLQLGYSVRA